MPNQMIDPKPYVALVDALNAVEKVMKDRPARGIMFEHFGLEWDFGGHYSIQYDSEADRWTLIPETDNAPDLCSFNQTKDECREVDLCEQCQEVAEMLEDTMDARNRRT